MSLLLLEKTEQQEAIKSNTHDMILSQLKSHLQQADLKSDLGSQHYLDPSQHTHLLLVRDIIQIRGMKLKELEACLSYRELMFVSLLMNGKTYYHPFLFFARVNLRQLFASCIIPVENFTPYCEFLSNAIKVIGVDTSSDEDLLCEIGFEICKFYFIMEDWAQLKSSVERTGTLLKKNTNIHKVDLDYEEFTIFEKLCNIQGQLFGYDNYLQDLFVNEIPSSVKRFENGDFDCLILNLVQSFLESDKNDVYAVDGCFNLMQRKLNDLDLFKLSRMEEILDQVVGHQGFPRDREPEFFNLWGMLLYKLALQDADLKPAIYESPIMTRYIARNKFLSCNPKSVSDRLSLVGNQPKRRAILREFVVTGMSKDEEKYISELTDLVGSKPVEMCPWLVQLGESFLKRGSFANALQLSQMATMCVAVGPQPADITYRIQKLQHQSVIHQILNQLDPLGDAQSQPFLASLLQTLKSVYFHDLKLLAKVITMFIKKHEPGMILSYVQSFAVPGKENDQDLQASHCFGNCLLYFSGIIETLLGKIREGGHKSENIEFEKLGALSPQFINQMAESAQVIQFLTKTTVGKHRELMFAEIINFLDNLKSVGVWDFVFGFLGGAINSFLELDKQILVESLGPFSVFTHGLGTRKDIDWTTFGAKMDQNVVLPVHKHDTRIALEFLEQALLHRTKMVKNSNHKLIFMLGDIYRFRGDIQRAVV